MNYKKDKLKLLICNLKRKYNLKLKEIITNIMMYILITNNKIIDIKTLKTIMKII